MDAKLELAAAKRQLRELQAAIVAHRVRRYGLGLPGPMYTADKRLYERAREIRDGR